jgi:hypothetical protein
MSGLDQALRIMEAGARFKQGPVDWLRAAWDGPRGPVGNLAWALGPLVKKQVFRNEEVGEAVGIGLPILHRPQKLLQDLAEAHRRMARGRFAEAEKILVRAERERSESALYLVLAQLHLSRGLEAVKRGDQHRPLEECKLARDFLARAADAPTLVPASGARRGAAWGGLHLDVGWAHQAWEFRMRGGCAAVTTGHPLRALAPLVAGQAIADLLPRRADDRIPRRLLEPSRGPDPDRAELLPRMIDGLSPEEARYLLHCWRRDEPRNVAPYQLQARLELRLGNHGSALDWAQRGLTVRPGDSTLRQLERQAREALVRAAPPPRTSSRPGG